MWGGWHWCAWVDVAPGAVGLMLGAVAVVRGAVLCWRWYASPWCWWVVIVMVSLPKVLCEHGVVMVNVNVTVVVNSCNSCGGDSMWFK